MNNVSGDPNPSDARPSVFDFDTYPSAYTANNPIDWSRIPTSSAATTIQGPAGQFNYAISNYGSSGAASSSRSDLGNFSFCSTQTPYPVQFPFPSTSPPTTTSENEFCGGQSTSSNQSSIRCKRKTNSPTLHTSKQLITEERMAEHMSRLRISSEMASPTEPESMRTQRLYMCEEMRRLQTDSILPQALLLSQIQRPCTALVLWTPPRRLMQNDGGGDGDHGNNNEASVVDHNRIENDMDLDNI